MIRYDEVGLGQSPGIGLGRRMDFRRLRQTSVVKTLRFNVHYFGFRGLVDLPVLVARNYFFRTLRGGVHIVAPRRFGVKLGFPGTGTVDQRYRRGCWEVEGRVEFSGTAYFGHGSAISVGPNGKLRIGDGFFMHCDFDIHLPAKFGNWR